MDKTKDTNTDIRYLINILNNTVEINNYLYTVHTFDVENIYKYLSTKKGYIIYKKLDSPLYFKWLKVMHPGIIIDNNHIIDFLKNDTVRCVSLDVFLGDAKKFTLIYPKENININDIINRAQFYYISQKNNNYNLINNNSENFIWDKIYNINFPDFIARLKLLINGYDSNRIISFINDNFYIDNVKFKN